VSVVVPFRGDREHAGHPFGALSRLALARGDELIVADNTDGGVAAAPLGGLARVVAATGGIGRASPPG
jgi:hypothetical protein